MMPLCIKQHLRNIWSFIQERLTNTEAELKRKKNKKNVYKKACTAWSFNILIMQGLVIHRYENNLIIKQ